ncbi:hypothetical protein [Taibaiella chishuiensis]|nr:hypothetical protein [Taibaiella chishuiensis]
MKITLSMALLLSCTIVYAQTGKNFPAEIKALIEADASSLMQHEVKAGDGYNSYRTALKLEGFAVSYMVSGVVGNILSADYVKRGDAATMDTIYDRFNEIPFLVFDSKDRPGLIKKNETTIVRKIVLKSRDTGKTVLTATLDDTGAIRFLFSRMG